MSKALLSVLLAALVTAIGCGGGPGGLVCPHEMRPANPDGRGERCIDDHSSCDSPDDCASEDPCCESSCSDSGGGVFACEQACREPECTEGSCGPEQYCQQGLDECTAYCVPDEIDCPQGTFPADPYGTGNFVCVREDSDCLSADECPSDGCCPGTCEDQGDGLFLCGLGCASGAPEPPGGDADADGDSDAALEPTCDSDAACETTYGPGWTCDLCESSCVPPPPDCQVSTDCVLATAMDCCLGCAQAIPRAWLTNGEGCWLVLAEAWDARFGDPPDPGCDIYCGEDVPCPEIGCVEPSGVDCREGQCVALDR